MFFKKIFLGILACSFIGPLAFYSPITFNNTFWEFSYNYYTTPIVYKLTALLLSISFVGYITCYFEKIFSAILEFLLESVYSFLGSSILLYVFYLIKGAFL